MKNQKILTIIENFLKNPLVIIIGWIGGLCSIIAIPLTIFMAISSPELTYHYFNSDVAMILSKNDVSGLHVFHDEIEGEIKEGISVAKIRIWNAGKSPIRSSDIRKPIKIVSTPSIKIVGAKPLNINGERSIFLDLSDKLKGDIGIKFPILESGEGDFIQLTYIGDPKVKFKLNGKIIGQNSIDFWEVPTGNFAKWTLVLSFLIWMAGLLFEIIIWVYFFIKKPESAKVNKVRKIVHKALAPFPFLVVASLLYLLFLTKFITKWIEPF